MKINYGMRPHSIAQDHYPCLLIDALDQDFECRAR